MANCVYIATSIDGYIADRNNGIAWLEMIPNPGAMEAFSSFIKRIDAIVMGRNTFETVAGFGGDWPYPKPVFVCSHTLQKVPEKLTGKVSIMQGSPWEITYQLHKQGYSELYIDGGKTIQSFLEADLLDEMTISHIPILLGGGYPLFGALSEPKEFELVSVDILAHQIVSMRYRRKGKPH